MAKDKEPEIKCVDARGAFVDCDAPEAAYRVNDDADDAVSFVDGLRARSGYSEKSNTGVVVPSSVDASSEHAASESELVLTTKTVNSTPNADAKTTPRAKAKS